MAAEAFEYSRELLSWQDSAPVIELRSVLKANQALLGCILVISDGCPTLRFNPPLSMEDEVARWELANYAIALAIKARRDLMELLKSGRLHLPVVK